MITNLFAALFAQAMMAVPFVLPVVFAVVAGSTYLLLLVANTLFALLAGYRRWSSTRLLSTKAMVICSLVVAGVACIGLLWGIDGRYT